MKRYVLYYYGIGYQPMKVGDGDPLSFDNVEDAIESADKEAVSSRGACLYEMLKEVVVMDEETLEEVYSVKRVF